MNSFWTTHRIFSPFPDKEKKRFSKTDIFYHLHPHRDYTRVPRNFLFCAEPKKSLPHCSMATMMWLWHRSGFVFVACTLEFSVKMFFSSFPPRFQPDAIMSVKWNRFPLVTVEHREKIKVLPMKGKRGETAAKECEVKQERNLSRIFVLLLSRFHARNKVSLSQVSGYFSFLLYDFQFVNFLLSFFLDFLASLTPASVRVRI